MSTSESAVDLFFLASTLANAQLKSEMMAFSIYTRVSQYVMHVRVCTVQRFWWQGYSRAA